MAKAKTEMQVTGLAAPGRVSEMEERLSAIPGVQYAHVNLGAGKVTVEYDDEVTGAEALLAAVRGAGYEAAQC